MCHGHTVDMACLYWTHGRGSYRHVVEVTWQLSWTCHMETCVSCWLAVDYVEYLWTNRMVPRGPDMGCHVAPPPRHKSGFVFTGVGTHDLRGTSTTWQGQATSPPTQYLLPLYGLINI
jgi:hypothetical protein